MAGVPPGNDDTVRTTVPPPNGVAPGQGRSGRLTAFAVAILLAAGGGLFLVVRPQPVAVTVSVTLPAVTADPNAKTPALPDPTQGAIPVRTASAAQIERHVTQGLSVFRLRENPAVVVLDFDSLSSQARMMDRMAALFEKTGLPRNRILSLSELSDAEKRLGDTPDAFYYGHDYSAAEVAAFFRMAEREGITLRPEEQLLRKLAAQEGWLTSDCRAAVITVPRVGPGTNMTPAVRVAILTHELSHGEYFTNPAYAEYVHRFWLAQMTEPEREAMRHFLAGEGYDIANEDLLENETQAYLMFTTDPHFFTPQRVGMTSARREELRATFMRGMQPGWLRDMLAASMQTTEEGALKR